MSGVRMIPDSSSYALDYMDEQGMTRHHIRLREYCCRRAVCGLVETLMRLEILDD